MPVIKASHDAYKRILAEAAHDGLSIESGLDRLLATLDARVEGLQHELAQAVKNEQKPKAKPRPSRKAPGPVDEAVADSIAGPVVKPPTPKDPVVVCEWCGRRVRQGNLAGHIERVHHIH